MKVKAGTYSVGAAALLLIVGCFNGRHNNAEAVGVGSAGVGAGLPVKADAVMTSWSGSHTEPITDPADGATAFTVTVPTGWKFVGTILRPAGCHAPAIPADGLSYTVLSTDGVTAVGQMPGSGWFWNSDGTNPLGAKSNCAPVAINTANGFLLNVAVPAVHPNALKVTVGTLTPQEKQAIDQQRQSGPGNMRRTLDIGRVRVEYRQNGRLIDEQLGTVLTCMENDFPAYPQMHRAARTQRMCSVHALWFQRAPQGHLDELLAHKVPGAQIDHAWDQAIAQKMQQRFAAYQKASDAQFAAIQKHFSDVTKQMLDSAKAQDEQRSESTRHAMQADAARQASIDHAAQMQVRYSLDRQDFIDPNTGRKIETSNQFTHNWIGSDGTVVLGDDPTYNPNGEINPVRESFTELIPVN